MVGKCEETCHLKFHQNCLTENNSVKKCFFSNFVLSQNGNNHIKLS